jgi:hypothetical protein
MFQKADMSISRRLSTSMTLSMLVINAMVWGCCFDANAGGMGGGRGGGGGGKGGGKNYVPPDEAPKVNPFAPDSPPTIGVQARLDTLEKFVLGKTTKSSLETRAEHLEKKLVPYEHNLASLNIEKRVDNLWAIMAKANVNVVTTLRLNER